MRNIRVLLMAIRNACFIESGIRYAKEDISTFIVLAVLAFIFDVAQEVVYDKINGK